MQLLRKASQGLVVAFLALGFLALGPKSSFAFNNLQYNLIKIQVCITVPFSGEDFLVVVDSNTGGTLVIGDALAIITVIPICHPGGQFYAFLNSGAVTNVAVIPGL
jgi:hypothetical protein